MVWKPRTSLATLVASMGCWLERQAPAQIEYLKAENRLLRADLAKEIGTKALRGLDPLVSRATLARCHRELVAQKWTFLERRTPGRPLTKVDIEQLVVRMENEDPGWGHTRIRGALLNLDIKVGRVTIRCILKDHLMEPAPARRRRIPWSVFLNAHWKPIAASDLWGANYQLRRDWGLK